MENSMRLVCFYLAGFFLGVAVSEKVGPAFVFPNDVSGSGNAVQQHPAQPQQPLRTTTVYGFLDFTTTIDHTVVVFRPSSASVAPSSVDASIAASVAPSSADSSVADNNAVNPTKQAFTTSTTESNERPSTPSSPIIRKPSIKTGRISLTDDRTTTTEAATIAPTPTLQRQSNEFQSQSGGLPNRRTSGTQSSLAEKRRRFLAHSRRNRPTVPPPTSTDSSSPSNPFFRQRSDVSGLRGHEDGDQEMAETIEVTPSKVKRFQDLANLSTFFAVPNGEGDRKDRGGRVLVRKLYRRPGGRGGSSEANSKNRLLTALRRPNSKNRPTFADARALADEDEQHKKEQLHQQRLKEVLMAAAAANRGVTASANEIVPSSAAKTEPTSATIAEYLHDETAEFASADRALSSTATAENEADLPAGPASDFPELQGSRVDVDLASPSPANRGDVDGPTAPLPVVKTRRGAVGGGHGDPGLTVPLQLSIVTSTFSLTETKLQTSLLPVYDGTSTTYYTLTQSFLVTKTVTTYQTVPPKEFMPYLIPGNESYDALNDILPDMNDHPVLLERKSDDHGETESPLGNDPEQLSEEHLEKSGSEHLPVDANGSVKQSDPAANQLSPLNGGFPGIGQQQQMNPLLGNLPFLNLLGPAALGLNPYFNPYGLGLPQVVTTSRPVFETDVIFTSKLLPIIDGLTTSYHTVKAAASTVTRTSYETFTTQLAGGGAGNGNPLQHPGLNGQQPGQQLPGVSTVTSPHTFVTTETQTATQVFKLIRDGYKTSFRTVTSQTEVTRTVTTFSTSTVPLYNTQNLLPYFG